MRLHMFLFTHIAMALLVGWDFVLMRLWRRLASSAERRRLVCFYRYHGIVFYPVIEIVVVVISEALSQAFSREQLPTGAAAACA